VNTCKYQPKTGGIVYNGSENRVVITRFWNRVRNFGPGSGYPRFRLQITSHNDQCLRSAWDTLTI